MANACHFCLHLGTKCSLKQLLNPNCCALRQSDQLQMPKPERQPPLILHTWQRAFCALLETIALLSISPERGSRKTGSASPELLSRASGQKNKHEGFWLTRETSQTSGEPTKKPKQKHQTLKAHAEANDLMILKPETQTQTNTLEFQFSIWAQAQVPCQARLAARLAPSRDTHGTPLFRFSYRM